MVVYDSPPERSGNYAFLNVLNYIWISMSKEEMDILPPFFNMIRAETLIKKKVKAIKPVKDSKWIDIWMARWQPLICYTDRYNLKLSPTCRQVLDWNLKVFFLIVEDLWDFWKALPSFGQQHWDRWYVYIKKTDFDGSYLIRRIVP